MKTKVILVTAGVLCAGLLLGATHGTQTDPLVTLSYLNHISTPKLLKDMDTKLSGREKILTDQFDAAIVKYTSNMEKLLVNVPSGGTSTASVFTVVTVEAEKKLVGTVGTEFLLRSGSAVCVAASAPGLIDSTDGVTLASGGGMIQNHLYLSTTDGRGLKATSQCTVLVRGTYSIQ